MKSNLNIKNGGGWASQLIADGHPAVAEVVTPAEDLQVRSVWHQFFHELVSDAAAAAGAAEAEAEVEAVAAAAADAAAAATATSAEAAEAAAAAAAVAATLRLAL